jgi:hypothetical protein
MPKAIEDCVKKMGGTNKRTGKPFTESEKFAICTAAHKKKMGKANVDFEAEFIIDDDFFKALEEFYNQVEE